MAGSGDSSSLVDRLVSHLASTSAILKSQQIHEVDPTIQEKKELALELLNSNPSQFLYRFGIYLEQEHLQYFYKFCGDPAVDYHLCETQKKLNKHTSLVMVKNRRFTALEKMKSGGSYFTESEMKSREPLLYDQLIGQNLNDDEKVQQSTKNENDSFLGLLYHSIDKQTEKAVKYEQERDEDDVKEEFDSDESEDEEERTPATGKHKELLRHEFHTDVHSDFLTGKDKDFDYSKVDGSDEDDLLDMRARDDEERYFDEDDDERYFNDDSHDEMEIG